MPSSPKMEMLFSFNVRRVLPITEIIRRKCANTSSALSRIPTGPSLQIFCISSPCFNLNLSSTINILMNSISSSEEGGGNFSLESSDDIISECDVASLESFIVLLLRKEVTWQRVPTRKVVLVRCKQKETL